MAKKAKINGKEKCSQFEEMLMWTSYRYCIGRHTYVTSMAAEMAQHYYDRLDDERMEFTANDIRKEILDKLQWLPFNFRIHRLYDEDPLNPIDALLTFVQKENINTLEEFCGYANLEYDAHEDKYVFDKKIPTIKSFFSPNDIDELIPWENLAACFDKKNHKIITTEYNGQTETHRCFKSWHKKLIPCKDKPGYYQHTDFGWEPIWIPVDSFVSGNQYRYIAPEYITKVEDVKEKEEI